VSDMERLLINDDIAEPWNLPNGWEWVNISDLCERLAKGKTPKYGESGPYVVKTKHVYPEGYPIPPDQRSTARYREEEYLQKGDILITAMGRGSIGRVMPVEDIKDPTVTDGCILNLRPKKNVLTHWLVYYLRSEFGQKEIMARETGTAFAEKRGQTLIKPNDFSSIKTPYPRKFSTRRSLEIQGAILNRIESLLSEIKETRKLLDKMRRDAERVMDAALEEIFASPEPSWIEAELGNLIRLKSGEFLRRKDMQAGGKHPVYGGNGLVGYHDDYLFEDTKVIIGRVGAKCGCIHISEPKSWVTDNALYVHEKLTTLNDEYLAYLLSVAKLNQYASRSAQPVVSGRTIYPVNLKYTNDLNQQMAIVIHIDNIRSEMANINATIEKSSNLVDELEQSILERAFRGEL